VAMTKSRKTFVVLTIGLLLLTCVGVPSLWVYVFASMRAGQKQLEETSQAVQAGKVEDLLPWARATLSEVSRQWVGNTTFTRGAAGRSDEAAGRVPSVRSPSGWLLAFAMSSAGRGAEGKVLAVTANKKLRLDVANGVAQVTVDGKKLGTVRLDSGVLADADGVQVGSYQRGADGHLKLGDWELAIIDLHTAPDEARPVKPGPLYKFLGSPRSEVQENWALAAGLLELGWYGPQGTNDSIAQPN